MIPKTKEEWMQVWAILVTILVFVAGGWLYREWGAVHAAPTVMASAAAVTRADMGPIVSRDSVLDNAQHVVANWREADKVMGMYDDYTIRHMLAMNEIVVVMPRCAQGHPWIDQTKILIRYSCEGPMP